MMNVTMLSAARAEMHRAALWFDRRSRGLGDRLLDDIQASIVSVREFPAAFPPIDATYRKKLLDVFPYALIYRIEADQVTIVAVAHLRRKPRYWARRTA